MAMYAKVRRMRLRDGLSISEIARRTSLTRNTVKKWLKEPVRSEMKYERPAGPRKLDGYTEWLRKALETDARRPQIDRRTALRLHAQLQERGFTGSYCRVTEFIRRWKAEAGAVTARSAYVPLSFDWGEAFQFDWSEESLLIGGSWRSKIQLAHMKLCASSCRCFLSGWCDVRSRWSPGRPVTAVAALSRPSPWCAPRLPAGL